MQKILNISLIQDDRKSVYEQEKIIKISLFLFTAILFYILLAH